MRIAIAALAVACACTPHGDDLFGRPEAVPTGEPARALTVLRVRGETWIAAAFELEGRVRLYRAQDGWEQITELSVGVGPRSVAAMPADEGGATLATADTGSGTVTIIDLFGDGTLDSNQWDVSDPPAFHVSAADGELFVVRGTEDEAVVERWRRGALGWDRDPIAVPFATASAASDLDRDGDLDVVVARRTLDDAVALYGDDLGLVDGGTVATCQEPRAAAPWPGGGTAIACRDGIRFVFADAHAIAYSGDLYDVVAADLDADGIVDLAAPDLDLHSIVVWIGRGDPIVYPVSRGPVALRAGDVDADGDLDLVSAAFEARAIDVLPNRIR